MGSAFSASSMMAFTSPGLGASTWWASSRGGLAWRAGLWSTAPCLYA